MMKAMILVSVLLLSWTWTLQGAPADGDILITINVQKVDSDGEAATVAPTEAMASTDDATVAPSEEDSTDNPTPTTDAPTTDAPTTDAPTTEAPFNAEACNEGPETGPCRAFIDHYFYNSTSMSCEVFTYGGCGGNHNNFEKKEECMEKCHTKEDH